MKTQEQNKFLESEAWAKIRADIFTLRNGICEKCGKKIYGTFNVHHLTYERYGGDEEPEDLELLHQKCHAIVHGKLKQYKSKQRKNKRIKKLLKKTKPKKKNRPTAKKEPVHKYNKYEIAEMQEKFDKFCPCCGKER